MLQLHLAFRNSLRIVLLRNIAACNMRWKGLSCHKQRYGYFVVQPRSLNIARLQISKGLGRS